MCSEKTIADIDAGRSVVVKKKIAYSLILTIVTGVLGWLITVIFWVAGTTTAIADNDKEIKLNKTELIKVSEWKERHTDNHDEMIYNLTRLLEANGLEWKSFPKK